MPESLYPLALLACPIGMGAMMWMMMRGHRSDPNEDVATNQAELARLQTQIDQLQSAQRDRERDGAAGGPAL